MPKAVRTKDTITVRGVSGLIFGLKCDAKSLLKSTAKIWFWT